MSVDVIIPELGESISEGTIVVWLVKVGDSVDIDQPLLELETDKVTAELPAPTAGVITERLFEEGADVDVGAVVARIDPDGDRAAPPVEAAAPAPAAAPDQPLSPAVRRLVLEHRLDPSTIPPTGKGGRLLKGDVLAAIESGAAGPPMGPDGPELDEGSFASTLAEMPVLAAEPAPAVQVATDIATKPPPPTSTRAEVRPPAAGERTVRRVRMTRMRRAIARRLKEVQNEAAILTTFNEVDMKPVMDLRSRYKEAFAAKHGVKLGFMSFFVKAVIEALKEYPAVNGSIDGDELLFHDYFDVGVAVSSETGLVVPVVRDADRLSFAEVEQTIGDLARAARDGSLTLSQLEGGTFSITNGGTFGSMLSTPILNPPQSGILGMHNIVKRPWVVGDAIEVRPIMYVALSYDHRIVDGSTAVRFLVKIKQLLEDPARLLLEV